MGAQIAKDEPWNERLWGPVEVLGLDSVLLDSMVVGVSAKTMPGQDVAVERELRWRIKKAFDAAGISIVGGPAELAEEDAADPSAGMAAPSAYASATSPQSLAASPIPPPASGPRLGK